MQAGSQCQPHAVSSSRAANIDRISRDHTAHTWRSKRYASMWLTLLADGVSHAIPRRRAGPAAAAMRARDVDGYDARSSV